MPFAEIVERVLAKPEPDPVTMQLRPTRWQRPRCVVGLKLAIIERMKWGRGSAKIKLAIGTGDDRGKIRIARTDSEAAPFLLHYLKGGATIDLGYVTAFGMTAGRAKVGCKHTIIDNNTIEIELPDWKAMPDVEDEPDEPDEDQPAPEPQRAIQGGYQPKGDGVKRPPVPATGSGVKPAAKVAAPESAKDERVEKMGVVLRIGRNHWSIVHGDQRMNLTERQALFLRPLVKGFGGIMVIAQVMHSMDTTSSMVASDVFIELNIPIQDIGLKLRFVPKMGYSINKV